MKSARKEAGFTQAALADRLDMSVDQLRKFETGVKVRPLRLNLKIADILQTTLDKIDEK